jgi:hypothetical protein
VRDASSDDSGLVKRTASRGVLLGPQALALRLSGWLR